MRALNFSRLFASCLVFLSAGTVMSLAAPKQKAVAPRKVVSLDIMAGSGSEGQPLRLRGADARQQLLVTAKLDDGSLRDDTRAVKYDIKPANVVKVDTNGFLVPIGDGTATVLARAANGTNGALTV